MNNKKLAALCFFCICPLAYADNNHYYHYNNEKWVESLNDDTLLNQRTSITGSVKSKVSINQYIIKNKEFQTLIIITDKTFSSLIREKDLISCLGYFKQSDNKGVFFVCEKITKL